MEILSQLTKITSKPTRRRGRGIGSGLGGHTVGRGTKGDKARGKTKLTFDGTKIKNHGSKDCLLCEVKTVSVVVKISSLLI